MLPDSTILKKIQRQPKQTAGYKQLVRELGLHGEERRELNERLRKLIASGRLAAGDSDRYAIPQAVAASGQNLIVGRLPMHRDGFGFGFPDLSSSGANLNLLFSGDTFIQPPTVGA